MNFENATSAWWKKKAVKRSLSKHSLSIYNMNAPLSYAKSLTI